MPELPEEMYCSQQICIPPAFPYLLRQYAKAAIRTQPNDLLKWSTAYFRCLALNLPPPVKPRLEYPIPLDYHGLTPGWLKALVNQMPNARSVSFKLLWDRWIGACLKHKTLIEILLLGRFTDNQAIPWFNFIALCAGHLTENLTHTMIMVCEILTEEPEGGSAMIPVKTFMDVYRFLADIDASKPQRLPNIHFTDSVLGLYESEEDEKSAPSDISLEQVIEIQQPEEEKEASIIAMEEEDLTAIISCPDITAEEKPGEYLERTDFPPKGTEVLPDSIDKTFEFDKGDDEEASSKGEESRHDNDSDRGDVQADNEDTNKHVTDEPAKEGQEQPKDTTGDQQQPTTPTPEASPLSPMDDEALSVGNEDDGQERVDSPVSALGDGDDDTTESALVSKVAVGDEGSTAVVGVYQSVDTVQEDVGDVGERFKLKQKHISQGVTMEADETDQADEDHPTTAIDGESAPAKERQDNDDAMTETGSYAFKYSEDGEEECFSDEGKLVQGDAEQELDLPRYEWFDIPIVPGIGPTVPIELVAIVDEYMVKMAKIQHGVVMPRNVRHFSCPPLEIFDFEE